MNKLYHLVPLTMTHRGTVTKQYAPIHQQHNMIGLYSTQLITRVIIPLQYHGHTDIQDEEMDILDLIMTKMDTTSG